MKPKIMVVDDSVEICELISVILGHSGYETILKFSAADLRESFNGVQPDVILLDLILLDGHGLELLPIIKKQWPETEVIVLTGNATFDAAVEATKRGAYHFLSKPFDRNILIVSIQKALEYKRLNAEASALRRALTTMNYGIAPVFESPAIKNVIHTIERVAPSDVSILITGESGTGKEIIADLVHALSPRNKGPLIKINCAALPHELIESELFGSVPGASGGTSTFRQGLFRQASGGTLLLDELSEMPTDTQSKLLRVLEEKEARPVGGTHAYKTDCRIIASTNRKIEEAIKEGKLREDLFYRINAVSVHLAPLRERREDVLPLANAFLKRFAAQAGRNIAGFSPEAIEKLRGCDWPGNIRQLQNEVQRAALMCEGSQIEAFDLSIAETPHDETGKVDLTLMEAMERNTIVQILKETGGNKLETAKRLGIGRQTLYNKIKAYGIET